MLDLTGCDVMRISTASLDVDLLQLFPTNRLPSVKQEVGTWQLNPSFSHLLTCDDYNSSQTSDPDTLCFSFSCLRFCCCRVLLQPPRYSTTTTNLPPMTARLRPWGRARCISLISGEIRRGTGMGSTESGLLLLLIRTLWPC